MREIKFRVFNPNTNNIIATDVGIDKIYLYDFNGDNITEQEGLIIMQFTGLKDNNGKEIYEGDIVKYLDGIECSTESGYDCEEFNNIGVIFFDEECGRYDVSNKQGISYDDLFDCGIDFDVVGNVFENPDLVNKIENSF